MPANISEVTLFTIQVRNTTQYRYLDFGIETEDQSIVFVHNIVFKPIAQDLKESAVKRRENLTEVVRALPSVTHIERGTGMSLACSILVSVADPQYAVVDWTVLTPGSEGIPKPHTVFFYKNIRGEVEARSENDYKGEAKAEPSSKKGGRSGVMVHSFLSLKAFDPVLHSGEYSCHLHVDGIMIKMTSVVVPNQVESLYSEGDLRVKMELCDDSETLHMAFPGCFRCTALGYPVPQLKMVWNETELHTVEAGMHWGRPRHSVIAYFVIPDVQEEDYGRYECIAEQLETGFSESDAVNVTIAIYPEELTLV